MTVEILRLSGLDAARADAEAEKLLDIDKGPIDLSCLIVVDDTAMLAEREAVYIKIDTSVRTQKTLCVAVGPRPAGSRKLRLPVNLGGTNIPVLWVSSPAGINCRIAVAAVAIGHPPGKASGLDLLIEILLDQEMFNHVHEIFAEVPYRIANPGMWLVGQDDEAVTFAAALVLAIRALGGAGPGAEGPFRELLPSTSHGASLAEDGPLARYRDEVVACSDGFGKRGGRFRFGQSDRHTRLIEAGAALADLRDLVSELLRKANAVGDLSDRQRRVIADAGIVFPTGPQAPTSARVSSAVAEQPAIYRAVAKALQGGDALPLISKRLALTERELKHNGSSSYLPQVQERCPQQLIDRLANPPERPSRRGAAEGSPEQDLARAAEAAKALENLVVTVASREWSPAGPSRAEVGRIRAALDGTSMGMTEYAVKLGTRQAPGARPARLAGMLAPVLHELVAQIIAAEIGRPSANPIEALEAAREHASKLVEEWVKRVRADGISAQTPFPSSGGSYAAIYSSPDDVTEIREALLYQPVDEMWQLCGPDDLKSVLNLTVRPAVVGFAGRVNKDALAPALSRIQPVWTSSVSSAGLLRLVFLRPEYVSTGHVGNASAGSDELSEAAGT